MVNEPQVKSGGGGRVLGVRESKEALLEVKTKLEFALSRLNDQDTQRTGIEEIREFLQALYPDWFPMVISCIGEAGTNLKPLGRCESVKLLGLLAELHGEAVVPLLARISQVVVTRLQDADLHLREACAETVFRITRALVIDEESSGVFATLLKPLFTALGEHSKWVQIGAAACICSVIQGSPPPVVRDNLGRLCSRLVQHLSLPLAMAKPQLLGACIYAMDAVRGADFDEVLPSLMPCLESCLNASTDWQTRKQAIEVLQTIGDNPELGQSLDLPPPDKPALGPTPLQRRIALLLEAVRTDKIRAVREAVKDVMLRWAITKAPVLGTSYAATNRSSSPTSAKMWEADTLQRGERPSVPPRSSSPTIGAYARSESRQHAPADVERAARMQGENLGLPQQSPSMSGSAGVRQNRSIRAGMRERPDLRDEEVTVHVPPERPRASMSGEAGVTAAEKAAAADEKARAIKAALSGATLQGNKKPKPKRDRQSIFDGPTNTNFFMGFGGTPTGTQTLSTLSSGEADLGEDVDASPEESADVQEYPNHIEEDDVNVNLAREMRAAEFRAKRMTPATERIANGSDGTLRESRPLYSAEQQPEALTYSDDEVDTLATGAAMHGDNSERSNPSLVESTTNGVGGTNSSRYISPARRQRVDQGSSSMMKTPASKELSPKSSRAEVENGEASSQEQLLARLESLERSLEALGRTCADQVATITAQGLQLEHAERRLQLQEQQNKHQEQRLQQHEQQLLQQEKRLHDQEQKIQQQEQLCEEQQLTLREHEQQMEKQEQMLEQQLEKQDVVISNLLAASASLQNGGPSFRVEDQVVRTVPPEGSSRSHPETLPNTASVPAMQGPLEVVSPMTPVGASDLYTPLRTAGSSALREGLLPAPLDSDIAVGHASSGHASKSSLLKKASGPLWDKVLTLCEEQRFLEAYKQVIAEPEETCLLRLMQHTGPIVERLDAESNSRLIRRLIHILSSPGKDSASLCIEQVFSWLRQALDVGIHFTSSQVEDLAAAIQKASASPSFQEHDEAQVLLARVSALRRS